MRKLDRSNMMLRLPIIGTGALFGCIGEVLQWPLHVSLIIAIAFQFVLTIAWYLTPR